EEAAVGVQEVEEGGAVDGDRQHHLVRLRETGVSRGVRQELARHPRELDAPARLRDVLGEVEAEAEHVALLVAERHLAPALPQEVTPAEAAVAARLLDRQGLRRAARDACERAAEHRWSRRRGLLERRLELGAARR